MCYKVRAVDLAGNPSAYSLITSNSCETLPSNVSYSIISTKSGENGITDPLSYFGHSICDGNSGPFTYTFKNITGTPVAVGMQLYTNAGDLAIPGNMTSYNLNYNNDGVKWARINGAVWQVVTSTGKLSSIYSVC